MMHLLEFSHQYCLAICAALVPFNLLATSLTLGLVGCNRSHRLIHLSTAIASLFAVVMVLHVMTWFVIGVVMVPTYVLLALASVCLLINLWARLSPINLRHFLIAGGQRVRLVLNRWARGRSLSPKTAIQ